MGLDDLIPDDVDTSGSSRGKQDSGSQTETEYVETFSCGKGTKKFTEEQWEKVKNVVRSEYSFTVGELISKKAEERHDLLHEIAIKATSDREPETDNTSDVRCAVCGNDCSDMYVVIEGEKVHIQHNAAQMAEELDLEVNSAKD